MVSIARRGWLGNEIGGESTNDEALVKVEEQRVRFRFIEVSLLGMT